jgi:Holliday junction resolvase RusA-like endonuclease
MKIVLHGEPKSTQHLYRYACRGNYPNMYMTAEGKKLKQDYHLEARSQWGRRPPLNGDVELYITLYFGTKRRADVDNFHKLSLDALSGVVYEDDSQIASLHVARAYDKHEPRIEIKVGDHRNG